MVFTLIPGTAFAVPIEQQSDYVAEIVRANETKSFKTLDEAVKAAADNETITVLKDCTTDAGFNANKNINVVGAEGVKPTITFTKYGMALWAKKISLKNLKLVMNGIGSTPYYQEWGWMTICGQAGSEIDLIDVDMFMDGKGMNKHAIYADNGLKLYLENSNLSITGYGQDALEWNGGGYDYNVEMINSTYTSDHNRSGFTGTFNVKTVNSRIDVVNSTGNGSNGSNFYFNDSIVNFSNNGSHGLSATVLESTRTPITANGNGRYGVVARYTKFIDCKGDKKIQANNNGYNGVRIGLSSTANQTFTSVNSDFEIINNGYYATDDTWSGFVLRHVPAATMDKNSSLTVKGSANNGIRMYAGSKLNIEEGTPVIVMNNNSDSIGGNGEGGIRLVDESTLILPSNAQLYNNHADKAGDDIYLGNNSVINFGPTGAGWQLDGTPNTNDCLKNIDGWYDDSENNRWNAHSMEKLHVKKVNNGEYNNSIALKAAHGIQVEDVYNEGAPSFVKMDAVTRIPVKGAEFTLYKDDVVIKTAISNEKGEFSFGKLPIGKYLMKETKTPDGYAIMTEELNIEVYEDTSNINEKLEIKDGEVVNVINHGVKVKFAGSEDFFTALENGIVTVLNNATINVEFHKEWNDKGYDIKHPEEIKAMVKSNGVDFKEITISEADNWATVVKDLSKYTKDGKEVIYTVEETTKLPEYNVTYSKDGKTIINTYKTTDVEFHKEWNDKGNDVKHPEEIKAMIKSNGVDFKEITISEADNWSTVVKDLPKVDREGKEIVYTVEETTKLPDYDVAYSEDGKTIINTYKTTDVEFHKEWNDKGNDVKHPEEIKAMIKSNGVDFKEITISEADNWSTVVKDLPKVDKEGKEIVYTVEEITKLKNYVASYSEDGLTITNTYNKKEQPEVPDIQKPENNHPDNSDKIVPNTGDESGLALYGLLFMAMLVLIGALEVGRKRELRRK